MYKIGVQLTCALVLDWACACKFVGATVCVCAQSGSLLAMHAAAVVSLLKAKSRSEREAKLHKESGAAPLSWLEYRARVCRLARLPS